MPACPNCGRSTVRTEDWACQWCGFPLLYGSYKKIPKTYRQLKEEELSKQRPSLIEEPEPEPVTEVEPLVEAEAEVELEPEAVSEAEAEVEAEPEPVLEAEAEVEAEPEPIPEVEASVEPEPEVVSEAEPELPAIDITADELVSTYEAEGAAADAKLVNKILNVTGIVDRIEVKEMLDIYYIILSNAERNLLQGVRCVFGRNYGSELSELKTGQTVTVRGRYDGSIMDICIRDCVLVR